MNNSNVIMRSKAILVALISSCLIGCSKGEVSTNDMEIHEPLIEISSTNIVVDNSEQTAKVEFRTNGPWSAALSGATSWCSIDKTSGGTGDNAIIITMEENASYDERNASLTISSGTKKVNVTITQKQKDAILITSNKVEMDAKGGHITLQIKANVSFRAEIDKNIDWIHSSQRNTRGLSESMLYFEIDSNGEISSREGKIYIKSENITEEVTIYQSGSEPQLVITQHEYMVPSSGGTIKIEVTSNSEYAYILPDKDWISEPKTRSMSVYTHYITISENTSYDARYAEIVFKNQVTGREEIVSITQLQKDAIIIAKNEYAVASEKTTLEFSVNTNVDFDTALDVDWIHVNNEVSTRALVEKKLSFIIENNPSPQDRKGTIAFSHGDIIQKVVVVQDGRTDRVDITIRHSEDMLYLPTFVGNSVYGSVDWGDGSVEDIMPTLYHKYGDTSAKEVSLETWGITSFTIDTLNSISSITIYYGDGQNGATKD